MRARPPRVVGAGAVIGDGEEIGYDGALVTGVQRLRSGLTLVLAGTPSSRDASGIR